MMVVLIGLRPNHIRTKNTGNGIQTEKCLNFIKNIQSNTIGNKHLFKDQIMDFIYFLCKIAGFEPFDVQKHGVIAPAAWHGAKSAPKQKDRPSEFEVVATTASSVALSTKLKPADGERTYEAPVKSGTSTDTSGRTPYLTHDDLRELARRNVSKRAAEKAKPLWYEGRSSAAIAKAVGMSQRTIEGAIGAFNAALPQVTAVAVAND